MMLLQKYLSDECSPSEMEELFDYLQDKRSNRVLLTSIQEEFNKVIKAKYEMPQEINNRIQAKLAAQIASVPVVPIKPSYIKWLQIAASIVLVISTSVLYFYFKTNQISQQPSVVKNEKLKDKVVPGGNKALLILDGGEQIILEDAKNGILAKQGHTTINREDAGRVVYYSQIKKNIAPQFNTISIPRGGQYEVVLPDGTQVWLNASSSLRFPTVFNGKERKVELSGEAYFEVTKNRNMPFTVVLVSNSKNSNEIHKENMSIQVLGTHFNVMAYEEEGSAVTTLLEGSVKIISSITQALLKPGEQAVFHNKSRKVNVSAGNVEASVAWKKGYFHFENENIYSIMRKISRWYDVDIEYRGDFTKKTLWGDISRFENVSEVLNMLELTRSIHFKLEGRRVIVMP